MPEKGLQVNTVFYSGRLDFKFYEINKIHDLIINEQITMVNYKPLY